MGKECFDPEPYRGRVDARRRTARGPAERSPVGDEPSCVVLIVGSGAARLLDDELAALMSSSGHAPTETLRGAAVLSWPWGASAADPPPAARVLSVDSARDGVRLRAGCQYWVPPHCRPWFEGERARVAPIGPGEERPIDGVLASLARAWGSHGLAVVATSAGPDSELGVRALGAAGGLVLRRVDEAEPPSSSRPLEQHPSRWRSSKGARVLSLPPRLNISASAACAAALARGRQRGRVRAWVPRCRTGGTAYAIAMQLLHMASRGRDAPKLLVFGTDDDEEALAVARAGRYPTRAALGMDPLLRGLYMFDEGEMIRVSEAVREVCVFSRHELTRDAPMSRMDLLVCQRMFDGVSPARRPELVSSLHYALREGGLLLPLDHPEVFPDELFDSVAGGYLRAREPRGRALQRPGGSGERLSWPVVDPVRWGAPTADRASLAPFVATIGLPLVLCDSKLECVFSSMEARAVFGLSSAHEGLSLGALADHLPGGRDIVEAARRTVSSRATQELQLRQGNRHYLVRVAAASTGVSLVFTDVTALEDTKAQALWQQHQQAAVARLSELGLTEVNVAELYDEALGVLFGNISACSEGLILEVRGAGDVEVVASRGLGDDPWAAVQADAEVARYVAAAAQRSGLASLAAAAPASGELMQTRSAAPRPARLVSSLGDGPGRLACPIVEGGSVLGVIVLFARHGGIDASRHQAFVQSIANVLGSAVVRQRTRRWLALELEVSAALGAAADVAAAARGLASTLGAALGADALELWCSSESGADSWAQVFPPRLLGSADQGLARVSPERLSRALGGLVEEVVSGCRELLVPVPSRPTAGVLRLRGARRVSSDLALLGVLQRIARIVADFLERERILELSHQSEAAQRQISAELEAVCASLPVGVSIHDRTGAVRSFNRQLTVLRAAGDDPASAPSPLERLYAEEVPAWISRVLATGEPVHDVELPIGEGAAATVWLCSFAPIRDSQGHLYGASVVVQDITERKHAEAALREADRQKDDFLAMLGHELRNPIAAMRNATELLGRIEQPSPQLSRLHGIFARQTLQTSKLIDGLLDVARVARGKVELQLVPVSIVELVKQVVDDRRQQFEGRTLDQRLPDEQLWVMADRARMLQILDNLISNAIRFTAPTGRILVEVSTSGGDGVIRIADDGVGIDRELLPSIFEPFRQGDNAHGGLGLGLALVKSLVDIHGFELEGQSAGAGRGAAFSIRFPLASAPEPQRPSSRRDSRALDLLVVEDNPDIAETLAELLSAAGHHVELVASAEAALESLRAHRPEVVLCDLGLPGMDGIELAERLRADPELSGSRLIAMTGFGDASTRKRVEQSGFDQLLVKPVGFDALRACLARVTASPDAAPVS